VDEELYIRWTQFSSFSPIMTLFSAPANPTANVPFNYSKKAQESFKKHAQLRHRLFPYIYTYAHLTRLHEKRLIVGNPKFKNEYAFGDAFYVAPVVEKGSTSRMVHLPAGTWVNYWTEEQLTGGKAITVQAPVSEMPLFVKSGSIIPMKTYTQTLDKNFSRDVEIHYYNSDEPTDFTLIEDDGLSNAYQSGAISKTLFESAWVDGVKTFIVHPVVGTFEGMPTSRKIKLVIHQIEGVSSIQINSTETKNYRFDAKKKILTIDLGDCAYAENIRVRIL
jgi:alpha-glucosidase (family GH31 glycosyl hydrolase)